jgi:hypothetical protein
MPNRAATDEATFEEEEREDREGKEYTAKEKNKGDLPQRV